MALYCLKLRDLVFAVLNLGVSYTACLAHSLGVAVTKALTYITVS
jgi:hypothetical protein